MSEKDERLEEEKRSGKRLANGAGTSAARRIRLVLGRLLGCALLFGMVFPWHHARHPRAGVRPPLQAEPQSRFETAFVRAQQEYLRAQVVAKQRLEALEEWDGDSINGSAPERYHRSLIARTREIGWAEAAAREAAHQATTSGERYRATRLLLHVERDVGRRAAELELAKRLVALRPLDPQARLLLRYAAQEGGELTPPHRKREGLLTRP